ncbi:MAG: heavy metal translocating P-type ATPase, partial [Gammaproteobacteria bacterium]|nr:heavy metal translocating P-type ATPase [Gammaproteobacteria bacterium]
MDNAVRSRCFHCGEPVPPGSHFPVELNGQPQATCCAGCQAVALLILDHGLDRYYRYRQSLSRRAGDDRDRLQAAWQSVDDDPRLYGPQVGPGLHELILQTEGIVCAACAWLIRTHLSRQSAVRECHVDASGGLVRILWQPEKGALSEMALALLELGYKPHLPLPEAEARARREERAASLKRVGVAGLGMMQVMMYAVALYAGEAQGISLAAQRFLEWVSLLVTTPVLLYSGKVFFENAWRSLRQRKVSMDVPVALALGGAYSVSIVHFFRGSGPVWFDSVVMFIFFLGVARHVEMSLRHRNQASGAMLARLLPEWADRVTAEGVETVAVSELRSGDHVRVRSGESFPADGMLLSDAAEINEALLTGESRPVARHAGEPVIGGSINLGQAVEVQLEAVGPDSVVSGLARLIMKARSGRSSASISADRYAGWFVVAVLVLALMTGLAWAWLDPSRAFGVTLSVLVVSCPCAFSLASPSVVSAASRALLRHGIILCRSAALEALATVRLALFDKTGTLTTGSPRLGAVTSNPARADADPDHLLRVAASLEQFSNHPVAAAFAGIETLPTITRATVHAGQGISATDGTTRYHIGSKSFVGLKKNTRDTNGSSRLQGEVWLADEQSWLLRMELDDEVRQGAPALLAYLQDQGIHSAVVSGDQEQPVALLAQSLGIGEHHHSHSAQ